MEEDVHDIFKLHSNSMALHAAVSREADKVQQRAETETDWIEDLVRERAHFKSRLDMVVKSHTIPMQRMDAHIAAFSLQGDANEAKHKYIRQLNEYMKVLRVKRKPLMDKYTNAGKKYTGKQVDELIEGDLASMIFMTKTLEDHIAYLDSISSMMVNITFSMKYFKDMDDFTRNR